MNWKRPAAPFAEFSAFGSPRDSHLMTARASSTRSAEKYCSTRGRQRSIFPPDGRVVDVGAVVEGGADVVVGAEVVVGAWVVVVVGGCVVVGARVVVTGGFVEVDVCSTCAIDVVVTVARGESPAGCGVSSVSSSGTLVEVVTTGCVVADVSDGLVCKGAEWPAVPANIDATTRALGRKLSVTGSPTGPLPDGATNAASPIIAVAATTTIVVAEDTERRRAAEWRGVRFTVLRISRSVQRGPRGRSVEIRVGRVWRRPQTGFSGAPSLRVSTTCPVVLCYATTYEHGATTRRIVCVRRGSPTWCTGHGVVYGVIPGATLAAG